VSRRGIFTRCPACGYGCDSVSGLTSSDRPADGDVSVCLNCGAVSVFAAAAAGGLVPPAPADLAEILADEQVRHAVGHIRARGTFR